MFSVIVKNYMDLDVKGDLLLGFYNDRLMTTTFFPSDLETYQRNLERARHIRLTPKGLAQEQSIYVDEVKSGRKCIVATDPHLAEEMRQWVDKYALLEWRSMRESRPSLATAMVEFRQEYPAFCGCHTS
jgi:hypothetical protein